MVMSRTDGAPTLPIQSDEDAALMELERLFDNDQIDEETYLLRKAEIQARQRGVSAQEMTVDEQIRQNGLAYRELERENREVGMSPEEFSRRLSELRLPDRPPPSSTDGMPGPMTGTEEDYQAYMGMRQDPLEPMRQEGRDFQNARDYGRRVGGEAPFASEAEAAEYGRRNVLTADQERELRAQGMSDQEIKDQQRSQFDRDMAQTGITGGTGWVPVLGDDGRYTYMERAPSPEWGEIGATDTAIGGPRRVGPRADAGEVPRMLSRPDLERRGYEAVKLEGPYGAEYVYRAENISADMEQRLREDYGFTDEQIESFKLGGNDGASAYQAASRAMADQRRREGMAARAGVPLRNADGTQRSNMELRQLIQENRQAQLAERRDMARRARMASRPRNELGLMQLSDESLSDWERAALFAQIADDVNGVQNMTPLGVQAQNMQNAWRLAQSAMEGGAGSSVQSLLFEQKQAAEAAAYAEEVGEELGVYPSGRSPWGAAAAASQEQLDEIEERVESRFPGRGSNAVRGWKRKPPATPRQPAVDQPPSSGNTAPPPPSASAPGLPIDPTSVYPGVF